MEPLPIQSEIPIANESLSCMPALPCSRRQPYTPPRVNVRQTSIENGDNDLLPESELGLWSS